MNRFINYVDSTQPEMVGRIKQHESGPAVRIEILRSDKSHWFYTDIVPAVEMNDKNLYVAKPVDGDRNAWRHSFSLEEKKAMKNIDADHGCRRQVGLRSLLHWIQMVNELNDAKKINK